MANYYNVRGWKHTGFDYYNRPYSRDVLAGDYFADSSHYFQVNGVAVKRDDMAGLKYIDLQGSVKDFRGTQMNNPNAVGSQPTGGPWYDWEQVDYLCLVRTGYPGDDDFIDISGRQLDPWNIQHDGKLAIAYYFVTGLEPRARNVTRLFLQLDEWTTMGGASELTIESGFKIRGHITEAEDAAGYNFAPENVSLIEPLEVKSKGAVYIQEEEEEGLPILVSSTDLTQYSEESTVDAFVAQATNGQSIVFPAIASADWKTTIAENARKVDDPTQMDAREINIKGYGLFESDNTRVQHNLSVLYSAGQLELMDSFEIPKEYVNIYHGTNGKISYISNKFKTVENPTAQDITGYPRKADYIFGQDCLMAMLSGETCSLGFGEVSDRRIDVWAVCSPSGSPIARFHEIKEHPYLYDKTVKGLTWMKSSVTMQGASGSMWNQINNAFAQQTQNRAVAENKTRNKIQNERFVSQGAQLAVNTAIGAGKMASSAASGTNYLSGGKETWEAAQQISDTAFDAVNMAIDVQADLASRKFKEQSLQQSQNQLNASIAQQNAQAPYTDFVPDLNGYIFARNAFYAYTINTSAKDRARLKNYFKRYGYNGLYKPLTWDEINVKSRVNYIQAEAVCLSHSFYPMRVTAETSALLASGLFLWNEKPSQEAFDNNPDRT